jgi:hypothetical protein
MILKDRIKDSIHGPVWSSLLNAALVVAVAFASIAGAAQPSGFHVREGQNVEEVEGSLGKPDKIVSVSNGSAGGFFSNDIPSQYVVGYGESCQIVYVKNCIPTRGRGYGWGYCVSTFTAGCP